MSEDQEDIKLDDKSLTEIKEVYRLFQIFLYEDIGTDKEESWKHSCTLTKIYFDEKRKDSNIIQLLKNQEQRITHNYNQQKNNDEELEHRNIILCKISIEMLKKWNKELNKNYPYLSDDDFNLIRKIKELYPNENLTDTECKEIILLMDDLKKPRADILQNKLNDNRLLQISKTLFFDGLRTEECTKCEKNNDFSLIKELKDKFYPKEYLSNQDYVKIISHIKKLEAEDK
jgi:hypothetical protein